jgi:cation:H+ antiporter
MITTLLFLLLGLIVLTGGAQILVKGGAALASRLGLSPLVIGLTVLAYGTSSPEMVVSAQASIRGSASMAVGNVIGSNFCNLALILGLCALVRPVAASRNVVRREVPLLIGVTLVTALFLSDQTLARWEGAALLIGLGVYTWLTIRTSRRQSAAAPTPVEPPSAEPPSAKRPQPVWLSLVLVFAGLGLLVWGADLVVDAAVVIAQALGLSDVIIGLTVVAIGTSLPELATSLVAVLKGRVDLATGNVVGSSLFNLLGVLGAVGLIRETDTSGLLPMDLAVLSLVTLMVWPLVRSDRRVSRAEGALLLAIYLGYTTWMVMRQT